MSGCRHIWRRNLLNPRAVMSCTKCGLGRWPEGVKAPEPETQPDVEGWAWWAGHDEEWFNYGGPLPTRDAAIKAGHANDACREGFWIIEALQQPVRFSAQALIESQYFDNDNLFDSEHDEPERQGPSMTADAELQALLDGWTDKWGHTFVTPTLFANQRNLEWIAPAMGVGQ